MASQDYFQELMEEQLPKPKRKDLIILICSLILIIAFIVSAFFGGYYYAFKRNHLISDETYDVLKDFDESSLKTIGKFDLLLKSLAYADKEFYDNIDLDKLDKIAALAVMNNLDDFSVMASTEDLLESTISASVGVLLSTSIYNEYVISYVFEGTSAYNELQRGDKIFAVNGNRVEGLSSAYFKHYTAGGEGTILELTIDRPILTNGVVTSSDRITKTVTKTLTTNKQAFYIDNLGGTISNDIGYIKLLSFTGSAYTDFAKCLTSFKEDGKKALILDLRNNGGGSGDILGKIASYLIKDNHPITAQNVPIIELDNVKTGKTTKFYTEDSYKFLKDIKIYVLCNKNTASASEALIGAINFYGTGTTIGTTTYGKGVAQHIENSAITDDDLEEYTISLTVGFYYVYTKDTATYPSGRYTIDNVGITPQYEIPKELLADTINLYDDAFIKKANELYAMS